MNNKNIIRMSIKHQCEICQMNFPNKTNLQRHISNIHLKEKIYKCEHCDFICNQKGKFKKAFLLYQKGKPDNRS